MKGLVEIIKALYSIKDAIKGESNEGGGDENINNIFSDYILPDKIAVSYGGTTNMKMYNNIKEYLDDPEPPDEPVFECLYNKEHSNVEKCFYIITIFVDNNNLTIVHCDDSGKYSFALCTDQIINNPNNEVYYKIKKHK